MREKEDPDLYTRIQEHNLLRQYDLRRIASKSALREQIPFDKYTLWSLNAAAVANISQFGGSRVKADHVGNHHPPHFREVPNLMDRFFSLVHENWYILGDPTTLAAYTLWRLNWIHPFVEGNGRTARAACYYLLCLSQGRLLPGIKIVPERIRENRQRYYSALQSADIAWENGQLDVSDLSKSWPNS